MKLPPSTIILKPGNSEQNETGSWRSLKPVVDAEKCNGCGLCWLYCPEPAITKGKPVVIDYRYCKGCGICANDCPVKAIVMVEEGQK